LYWTSLGVPEPGMLAVYRGGGQLVNYQQIYKNNCTASSIVESENQTIENTVQSLDLANDLGVEIFHINANMTADGQFVVFHDWTLDCATNGSGVVNETDLQDILALDAGYGFTYDNGNTYPFRGKGYRISTLKEVLNRFPKKEFWVNLKANSEEAFDGLRILLENEYPERLDSILVFTSPKGLNFYQSEAPRIAALSFESTKSCVIQYIVYGWTSIIPPVCEKRAILLPPSKTKYLWGYPEKLAAHVRKKGGRVFLWEKHTSLNDHKVKLSDGIGVVSGDLAGIEKVLN